MTHSILQPESVRRNPATQTNSFSSDTPLERITSLLDGVFHQQNGQVRAICPSHDSKHRSKTLALKETDEGGVVLHCFAGCSAPEILGALGLELKDLFPEPINSPPGRPFTKKAAFSPREALQILAFEVTLASAFIGDVINHRDISKEDWNRFLIARDRITKVFVEYQS